MVTAMCGVTATLFPEIHFRVAPPAGRWWRPILKTKTLQGAQDSIRVPPTLKCSSCTSPVAPARFRTRSKKAGATSEAMRRPRFSEKMEWSQAGLPMDTPTNYRNRKL